MLTLQLQSIIVSIWITLQAQTITIIQEHQNTTGNVFFVVYLGIHQKLKFRRVRLFIKQANYCILLHQKRAWVSLWCLLLCYWQKINLHGEKNVKVCLNSFPFQKLVFYLTQVSFLTIDLPEYSREKVQKRQAKPGITSVTSWCLHCTGSTAGLVFAQHLEKHWALDLSLGKCSPLSCEREGRMTTTCKH